MQTVPIIITAADRISLYRIIVLLVGCIHRQMKAFWQLSHEYGCQMKVKATLNLLFWGPRWRSRPLLFSEWPCGKPLSKGANMRPLSPASQSASIDTNWVTRPLGIKGLLCVFNPEPCCVFIMLHSHMITGEVMASQTHPAFCSHLKLQGGITAISARNHVWMQPWTHRMGLGPGLAPSSLAVIDRSRSQCFSQWGGRDPGKQLSCAHHWIAIRLG